MAPTLTNYRVIGSIDGESRVAYRFSPGTWTLFHLYIFAERRPIQWNFRRDVDTTKVDEIFWELRADDGKDTGPELCPILRQGSFSFREQDAWQNNRPQWFGIHFPGGVQMAGGYVWLVLRTPGDAIQCQHELVWFANDTMASNDTVWSYSPLYGWSATESDSMAIKVTDDQAGDIWHLVIDGKGYMTDDLRSAKEGLAQSMLTAARGGQQKYSELVFPYTNIYQDDWSNGMGQVSALDPSSYRWGMNIDTHVRDQITLSPHVAITSVAHTDPANWSRDIVQVAIPDPTTARQVADIPSRYSNFWAQSFTTPAGSGYNLYDVCVYLRLLPEAANSTDRLYMVIMADDSGVPDQTTMLNITHVPQLGQANSLITRRLKHVDIQLSTSPTALSSATRYWLGFFSDKNGGIPNYAIGVDPNDGLSTEYLMHCSSTTFDWQEYDGFALQFELNWNQASHKLDGAPECTAIFGNTLYCGAGKKVYSNAMATPFAWSEVASHGLIANAASMAVFGGKLWVSQGAAGIVRSYDGTTWYDVAEAVATDGVIAAGSLTTVSSATNSFLPASGWQAGKRVCLFKAGGYAYVRTISAVDPGGASITLTTDGVAETDISCYLEGVFGDDFLVANGALYLTQTPNHLIYTTSAVITDPWSAEIHVGTQDHSVTGIVEYQGNVLVFKDNAAYQITVVDDTASFAVTYIPYDQAADSNNGTLPTKFAGYLFFPVGSDLWRWTGNMWNPSGPNMGGGYYKKYRGMITAMTSSSDLLFAAVSAKDDDAWTQILAYNGLGWHPMSLMHAVGTGIFECHTMILDTTTSTNGMMRLWYGTGKRMSYMDLSKQTTNMWESEVEYNAQGGWYFSSWWDGGLSDAQKFFNRVSITLDLPVEETWVEVYYVLDGKEDWDSMDNFNYLGTLGYTQEALDRSVCFPDTVTGKSVQIILHLCTNDNSYSPRIRALNLECLVSPQPTFVSSFRIKCSDDIRNMARHPDTDRTGHDMVEELKRLARRSDPILVSTPTYSFRAKLINLLFSTEVFKTSTTGEVVWERLADATFIEVL